MTQRWFGSWFRGVVRACLFSGTAVGALGWAVGAPADSWRAITSGASGASGAGAGALGFEHLLVGVAGLAAWIGLGWFCAIVGLQLAGAVPGIGGRMCEAASRFLARLTPGLLRRFVEVVVGISVLAAPVTAGSALAATSAPTPTPSASSAEHWRPELDRPTSPATAAPGVRMPPFLDRPANPYVPPAPQATAVETPAGPAALIAGSPHRDIDHAGADRGYVVRRGDALWDIAARHLGAAATAADIAREWPRWYEANRAVIGADPGLIHPGELLVPP